MFTSLTVISCLIRFVVFAEDIEENNLQAVEINVKNGRDPKILGLLAILHEGARLSHTIQLTSSYKYFNKQISLKFDLGHHEKPEPKPNPNFFTVLFPIYHFGDFNNFYGRSLSSSSSLQKLEGGGSKSNRNMKSIWHEKNGQNLNSEKFRSRYRRDTTTRTRQNDEDANINEKVNSTTNLSTDIEEPMMVMSTTEEPSLPILPTVLPNPNENKPPIEPNEYKPPLEQNENKSPHEPSENKPNTSYIPSPSGNPWKQDHLWNSYYHPLPTICSCPPTTNYGPPLHSNYYKPPLIQPHEIYNFGPPVIEDLHYISYTKPPPILQHHHYGGYTYGHAQPSFKPSIPDQFQNNWDAQTHTFYPAHENWFHKK